MDKQQYHDEMVKNGYTYKSHTLPDGGVVAYWQKEEKPKVTLYVVGGIFLLVVVQIVTGMITVLLYIAWVLLFIVAMFNMFFNWINNSLDAHYKSVILQLLSLVIMSFVIFITKVIL